MLYLVWGPTRYGQAPFHGLTLCSDTMGTEMLTRIGRTTASDARILWRPDNVTCFSAVPVELISWYTLFLNSWKNNGKQKYVTYGVKCRSTLQLRVYVVHSASTIQTDWPVEPSFVSGVQCSYMVTSHDWNMTDDELFSPMSHYAVISPGAT